MSRRWVADAARRLGQPLALARLLYDASALGDLGPLYDHWRHRRDLGRVRKALFHHRLATALLLAHEVRLFEALGDGAAAAEVAARAGLHPRAADTLLRILEAAGLVVRRGAGFAPTAFAARFLQRRDRWALADTLDLVAAQAAAFPDVVAGLRTGAPPPGLDVFTESGRYRAFLYAVNEYLHYAVADLLGRVELPEVRSFIVGSMGVSASAHLLRRFPDARVTYGCLPHLVREVPSLRERYGVPAARVAGMHAHGGDPDADRWGDESFDLVLLTKKMILDPEARVGERFAKKALGVLRPGGAAVFWEAVHGDDAPSPLGLAMEATMDLCASPAAAAATPASMRALLEGLGYADVTVVPCLGGDTTFVVARRG